MATLTVANILARARTLATQSGGVDANASQQIDSRGGLFALLPHIIADVYRGKAKDPKFVRDITVKHTVAMSSGVGAVPDGVMREFLRQANFADENNSLITYYEYAADYNSGQNFDQLGYTMIVGDEFQYTPPAPTTSYTGDFYVTVASTPAITTSVTFPSEQTATDVVMLLASAIQGKEVIAV